MRSAMNIIVAVCLLLVVQSASLAQGAEENLEGMITVNGKIPGQPGIRLRLQAGGVTIEEIWPRDGKFAFPRLRPSRYTIVADAPGFETANQTVDLPWERFVVIDLIPQQNAAGHAEVATLEDLKIPESARRQFAAGKKKLVENRCAEAMDHLRKAIHAYGEYGDAHRAMGECYTRMDQLEAAEQEFKRALEKPHLPDLHLQLGKIYAYQNNEALLARQIELFVAEEKPSPFRDQMQRLLERHRKE